jgi:hypothetical protein
LPATISGNVSGWPRLRVTLPAGQPSVSGSSTLNLVAPATIVAAPAFPTPVPLPGIDLRVYVRAGNAVATMAFGLLGCLLAPLAIRAANPKAAKAP